MGASVCRRAFIACAWLSVAGCGADPTQLVVVVDTDIAVPSELDEVRVTVTGPGENPVTVQETLADAASLPLTLGVSPSGDSLGPVTIVATGLFGGGEVVTRTVRTSLVRGETRALYILLLAGCRETRCPAEQTCTGSGCASIDVDPRDLPHWTGEPAPRDAGTADLDARTPDGGSDAGTGCTSAADCDDGIGCTIDACDGGDCAHQADDAACSAAEGGTCDPIDGCQYPVCDETTCTAGPCQTAACVGSRCERTSVCEAGETCCAGACVAMGCSDGNPCTDDSCGTTGCMNMPNTSACDDATYCNGTDTCSGGTCSVHAGSPCAGSAVCDESMDVCTGCLSNDDCSAPTYGAWGTCNYDDVCDESGTRSRSVTSYSCMAGTCVGSTSTDTEPCTRSTDGTSCGATTCGSWSCGGFLTACDESGTETRTCTDRACASGTCASSNRTETRGCSRDTDGDTCNDGISCTYSDDCRFGSCSGTDVCGGSCYCEPALDTCVDPTEPSAICPL